VYQDVAHTLILNCKTNPCFEGPPSFSRFFNNYVRFTARSHSPSELALQLVFLGGQNIIPLSALKGLCVRPDLMKICAIFKVEM